MGWGLGQVKCNPLPGILWIQCTDHWVNNTYCCCNEMEARFIKQCGWNRGDCRSNCIHQHTRLKNCVFSGFGGFTMTSFVAHGCHAILWAIVNWNLPASILDCLIWIPVSVCAALTNGPGALAAVVISSPAQNLVGQGPVRTWHPIPKAVNFVDGAEIYMMNMCDTFEMEGHTNRR